MVYTPMAPLGDKPKLVTLKFLTFSHFPLQLLCSNTEQNHSPPFPDGGSEEKRGCNSASFMYLYWFQRLGYRKYRLEVASEGPVTLWVWEAGRDSHSLEPGGRFLQGTVRMVVGCHQLPTDPAHPRFGTCSWWSCGAKPGSGTQPCGCWG